MGSGDSFAETDRLAARAFAKAARGAGVGRIIYLGGLGGQEDLSSHQEVGRKLVDSLRNETVVKIPEALDRFDIRPRTLREAIARALVNED